VIIDVIDGIAALVLLAAVVVGALLIRRILLGRRGASLGCALRLAPLRPGYGWRLGVVRYTPTRLEWFRMFSLSPQPACVLVRRSIGIVARRPPRGFELHAIPHGAVVLRCRARTADGEPRDLELAMSQHAVTGFLAWVESAPPGVQADVRRR
jgi:hypothetical protein